MGLNIAGLAGAINAIDTLSLHSTNPGGGTSPAGGSELTDSPYTRKAVVVNAAVDAAGVAVAEVNATVEFDLSLTINQNVQFIGLWQGATYKGYAVPDNPNNFTGSPVTVRKFRVLAGSEIAAANV